MEASSEYEQLHETFHLPARENQTSREDYVKMRNQAVIAEADHN